MKHIVSTLLPVFFAAVTVFGADFCLFKDGKPAADIVRSKADIKFFNECVARCTKAPLPLVNAPKKGRNSIQFKFVEKPVENDDEFTITFPQPDVMLITGTKRSVNSALTFMLEEYFNCRFVFPTFWRKDFLPYGDDINHFPEAANVTVPAKPVKKTASFYLKREVDWKNNHFTWRCWNGKYAMGTGHYITKEAFPALKYMVDQSWPKEMLPILKGKKYVPPKPPKPYPTNPYKACELYSCNWNPCFSHPESAKIAIANLMEYLAANPKAEVFALGINDNGGMCECDLCRKAVGKKRTITGHSDYSQIYWKWMNTIADAVTKKYPNVKFTGLAYREVLTAPDFKLNKNIVPELCFELTAMNEPSVEKSRRHLLATWKKAAANILVWDYAYGMVNNYVFPRIYFKSHTKWMDTIYREYNVRGIFFECDCVNPSEGPKTYLMSKKCYDVNTDPEKTVMEWINVTVGPKSAPYLRAYYQFWEDYWTSPEIKKTHWYQTNRATYMLLGELPTHTLALKKGDMKRLRTLMEKTVANTQTPQQKKRAEILMQLFELSEGAAKALFSETLPPNGKVPSAAVAADILRQVPGAFKAYEDMKKNPFFGRQNPYSKVLSGVWSKIPASQYSTIGLTMSYLKDPAVRKEAEKLAAAKDTPLKLKGMLKVWLGAKAVNLIPNSSFEESSPMPRVLWNEGGGYRTAKIALDGDYSFRLPPFCCYAYEIKVDPAKTYLFMFDVYLKKESPEGLFSYQLSPKTGGSPCDHIGYKDNKLPAGKWTTFSGVAKHQKNSYKKPCSIELMIYLRKFEKDDEIYIDNVRAYCLDDLK